MRISRVYKRTQVLLVTIDIQKHQRDQIDNLFERELEMMLDPAWTTLDESENWMEA